MGRVAGLATELFDYLGATAGQAAWQVTAAGARGRGSVGHLQLSSQVWRGMAWDHRMLVARPGSPAVDDVAILIVGGDPAPEDAQFALQLARQAGLPVAVLSNVPVQPLLGLREDALIAHTFARYLAEGDPDWPLLFPMTRAALAAMDAAAGAAADLWGVDLRGFVVTGASKLAWTTYLAAAAAPDRVLGIVPMAFDILDILPQIAHQVEVWGEPSPMIHDYLERGLIEAFAHTPRGARLGWLVDPYSYRCAYTMPKLVVRGANDPYWPVDALRVYWPGLPDPKWALMVPNCGHAVGGRPQALSSLAAFARAVAAGLPLPTVTPCSAEEPGGLALQVGSDPAPVAAKLWVATSPARDFREAEWRPAGLACSDGRWRAQIPRPGSGYVATYAQLTFTVAGIPLHTTTPTRVVAGAPTG